MRMAIIALAFAAMQIVAGNSVPMLKPSLRLVLSPERTEVMSNHEFTLGLDITNLSTHVEDCAAVMDGNLDLSYTYYIRAESGERLTRVGPQFEGTVSGCRVNPGLTASKSITSLMSAYGMQKPGTYTVQVSHWDPDHPKELTDDSNVVKVVVQATR
jgi:hypothetical protein